MNEQALVPELRFREFKGLNLRNLKLQDLVTSVSSGKSSADKQGVYKLYGSTGVIGSCREASNSGLFLLIARVGANAGTTNLVSGEFGVTDNTLIVTLKDKSQTIYLYYFLGAFNLNRLIFGSGQPLITGRLLKAISVNLPDMKEQQKIACFLSAVDKKISSLKDKHRLLVQYKKGVMQQIFSQQIRFKDDNGQDFPDWDMLKLGEVFENISQKNTNLDESELLSVTMNDGVKKRSEIEGKDNSSEDKSNYRVVSKGDLVYNSMRMWQGASGVSSWNGIVSPAYTIVRAKRAFDVSFFAYYFKHDPVIFRFRRNSQGLTSDTWNLKYPQFSSIKLDVPCIREQIRITRFLELLDKRISLANKQVQKAQIYKKGLLQKMFV